ncbi:hypothetical protein AAG570_010749 [Ranatra chinensis]|uniref:Uncharacterized protein n=1 Tax=Ranatra chinensis TaxID=642074 RepID=A0ABD0YNJ3_9HEMI
MEESRQEVVERLNMNAFNHFNSVIEPVYFQGSESTALLPVRIKSWSGVYKHVQQWRHKPRPCANFAYGPNQNEDGKAGEDLTERVVEVNKKERRAALWGRVMGCRGVPGGMSSSRLSLGENN